MSKPSDEQQEAIDEAGKFVLRACPGSGKTYTVGHRLAMRLGEWSRPHAGIAALSFTNVAHEEISRQLQELGCAPVPPYPHFLGTIDSYVNAWIFLPFGHLVMRSQDRPTIVGLYANVWNPVGNEWVWGKRECHRQCRLIDFSYDINGKLTNVRGNRKECPYNWSRCSELKKRFVRRGYANQSDANFWAMRILEEYPQVARALAGRFPEMVVDEAQDTSDIQMRIIDLLAEQGLSEVMLVGDPDQAIYEWRDAKPELFQRKMTADDWKTRHLTENRRSSQHICKATRGFSTLDKASKAVGDDATFPVLPKIVEYDPADLDSLKDSFVEFCEAPDVGFELTPANAVILVRGRSLLRRMAGLGEEINPWNDDVTRLLACASNYRDNGDLKQAVGYLQSAVAGVCFGDHSHTRAELDRQITSTIGERNWRIGLWRLLKLLPPSDAALATWVTQSESDLKKWFQAHGWPTADKTGITLKVKEWTIVAGQRRTDYKSWPVSCFFVESSFSGTVSIETIHAAKGRTYEAVLFVVTSRGKCTTKQLAKRPIGDEEIRTAYVAMTRPRKILMVAIPQGTDRKRLHRFPEWMVTPALG